MDSSLNAGVERLRFPAWVFGVHDLLSPDVAAVLDVDFELVAEGGFQILVSRLPRYDLRVRAGKVDVEKDPARIGDEDVTYWWPFDVKHFPPRA